MIALAAFAVVVVFVAALRVRSRRRPIRTVTAATVLQLPELDGPRYRRRAGKRRQRRQDGRP